MDLTSLRLRIQNRLQPPYASAAIRRAVAAITSLYFRAWRRWNKPGFKSGLFRAVCWALVAIFYGLVVGAATVMLPPMGPVALVAMSAPVLFWALPDLPTIPAASLRRIFFITVAVELSVPAYYMVQISGLPWISIRRLAIFALILLLLYSISVSRQERRTLSETLSQQYLLKTCVIGYLFMAFVSILSASEPMSSFTTFIDLFLNWYLPFFACLLVIHSEKDVIILYKLIALLSLFVAALGVLDFATQHNWAVEAIPRALLEKMMADNPAVADLVNANPFRNGQYRASSIYGVPLSYGEFACMVAPIGLHFIFHARKATERLLGILVLIGSILSIFVSGSRGGSVAFLVSVPLFVGLWVVRYSSIHLRSVVGPLFATIAAMGVAALFALVLTWKKLHNIVLGGGDAAASDDSRHEQWALGWPHIYANPLTGHGIGTGGQVVNWHSPNGALSIDTYALNLLVETGVPGFVFYFGMILVGAGLMIRIYLRDRDRGAEIGAAIASSLIAYGVYRLVLSQRENQTLFFIFLGIVFVVAQESAKRLTKKNDGGAALKSGAPRKPRSPDQNEYLR